MFRLDRKIGACDFTSGDKRLRISFVNEDIVRVSYIEGKTFKNSKSRIVTAIGEYESFQVEEDESLVRITTGRQQVCVFIESGAICFVDSEGTVLLREPQRGGRTLTRKDVFRNVYDKNAMVATGQSIDGARAEAVASERVFDRQAFEAKLSFTFADDEALFGLGSHEEGYGNLRGKTQHLYQQNMKAVVPCLVSSKGYGLLWDCTSLMVFQDDVQGCNWWADCVDQIDFYFIGGGDASAVARNTYKLTGAPPMLPRWAFGYVQSKERYVNAEEILEVAREYRRRNIPLDVMVLDWKSWPDGEGWGQKSFDPARFPDPKAFIDELHALDIKLMVSIWPIMSGECPNQIELRERGLMLGNQATYNAFDPQGREIYWKQARDGLFAHGVDAWWCDCTEPFEADWIGAVKPEANLRMALNTNHAKRYIDEGELSAFSLLHSQGIYEGQRRVTPDKRVVNLTRSSYAGQHRYSTVSWSGDICATWEVLRRSIPEGVNFCATGEPYWTVDIGAFFIGSDPERWFWRGDYKSGCRGLGPMSGGDPIQNDNGCSDLGYWELYTRWLQYGSFLPMFRSHGTDAAREIWRFGNEGNRFYDTIAKYIRLRYQLLPYIYSVAASVADSGLAMLRPVAMQYPKDIATFNLTDQYFFGPSLMVCPVTTPMYYGRNSESLANIAQSRPVVLPLGRGWYNYWSEAFYTGGQTIEAAAPLEIIPLFVPAGSIILIGPVTQHATSAGEDPLEVHIYAGADAELVWYEDAGDGYAYEQGECARVGIHWLEYQQIIKILERQGDFKGMLGERNLLISIHTPNGLVKMTLVYSGREISLKAVGRLQSCGEKPIFTPL